MMTPSKKDIRLKRKLEKTEKQKNKNARLINGIKTDTNKTVHSISSEENYRKYLFSWCMTCADREGFWSWRESRDWNDEEFQTIQNHMNSLANSPWSQVENFTYNGSGGARKLLNKYQELNSICDEAQVRWLDLDIISQFEELFRLRLGSSKRIWGVRIEHHFYMVWYERRHKICPIEKE